MFFDVSKGNRCSVLEAVVKTATRSNIPHFISTIRFFFVKPTE